MPERLHLSYHIYGTLLEELTGRLNGTFTHVYGLPLAVHLAHYLRLPMITNKTLLDSIGHDHDTPHVLLIDDIADTGRSLERLIGQLRATNTSFTTATLYYKPRSVVEPDIWLREVPDNTWVVFPWELPDETPNRHLGSEST